MEDPKVTIKRKGIDLDSFLVDMVRRGGESDASLAQRAVYQYDHGGDGKVRVDGSSFLYRLGTIQPTRHC